MATDDSSHPSPSPSPEQLAAHVEGAKDLLRALQEKLGQYPEIGQAIHKLELALAILETQTGGML